MDKYRVTLTAEERADLGQLVSVGKAAARKLTHARILLLADDSLRDERPDDEIMAALGTSLRTVAPSGASGQPRSGGLRVRAQGRLPPAPDVRAVAWLASRQGDGAADAAGLRGVRAGVGGCLLPGCGEDPAGAGQPEHARRGQP